MSGLGGRPKGGSVKKDDGYDKNIASEKPIVKKDADDSTKENIRDAIQEMLTQNLANLPHWLSEIGENDPKKALDIFKEFAEYVVPKQQRTDNKNEGVSGINIVFAPSSQIRKEPEPKKKISIDEFVPTNK